MLKITIELIPWGIESQAKTIGQMKIWNDATGTKSRGNYKFRIFRKNSTSAVWKYGEIKDFKRQIDGAWKLLFLCLRDVFVNKEK